MNGFIEERQESRDLSICFVHMEILFLCFLDYEALDFGGKDKCGGDGGARECVDTYFFLRTSYFAAL
jgi:hypothetical protein